MTASEHDLKLQMRLYAVEVLVANLLAAVCLQISDPANLIAEIRRQIVKGARLRTLAGLDDPAISDLFSAMSDVFVPELESSVERLMGMASSHINAALKAEEPKTGAFHNGGDPALA